MKDTRDDGGPAFPVPGHLCEGMTLRDWFAGQALAGLVSIPEVLKTETKERVALSAYNIADAMLAQRVTP